jgi:hypothetical protein
VAGVLPGFATSINSGTRTLSTAACNSNTTPALVTSTTQSLATREIVWPTVVGQSQLTQVLKPGDKGKPTGCACLHQHLLHVHTDGIIPGPLRLWRPCMSTAAAGP